MNRQTIGVFKTILLLEQKHREDDLKLLKLYGVELNEDSQDIVGHSSEGAIKKCYKYGIKMYKRYGSIIAKYFEADMIDELVQDICKTMKNKNRK